MEEDGGGWRRAEQRRTQEKASGGVKGRREVRALAVDGMLIGIMREELGQVDKGHKD